MKKEIILEGKPFIKNPTFNKIYDSDIKSIGKSAGIPLEGISRIKITVANIIGKINSKNFISAAKLAEKDDADDIDESISMFNKTYKQLILEAEDEVESGTDSTGKVYWLVIKNGKGLIQTKDGAFDSSLNDDALSEFIKKVKEDPKAFKDDKKIIIGSADDAKEDAKDAENSKKEVLKMISKEGIDASEVPELSDFDGFSASDEISTLAKDQTEHIAKKLTKDKVLVKLLFNAKIEEKTEISNFIFGVICAAIFAQGIRATKASINKAKEDKKAINKVFEGYSPYDDIVIPGFCKGARGLTLGETIEIKDVNGKLFNLSFPKDRGLSSDEDYGLLAHTLAQGVEPNAKRDADPGSYIHALEIIRQRLQYHLDYFKEHKQKQGEIPPTVEESKSISSAMNKCDELIEKLKPLQRKNRCY